MGSRAATKKGTVFSYHAKVRVFFKQFSAITREAQRKTYPIDIVVGLRFKMQPPVNTAIDAVFFSRCAIVVMPIH
jgi:hypothetical protein